MGADSGGPPAKRPRSPRGLTDEEHLCVIRVCLKQDMKEMYGKEYYWEEVSERFKEAGFQPHKRLVQEIRNLEKQFDEWLEGGGNSMIGRENEDELTVARRKWAKFKAEERDRIARIEAKIAAERATKRKVSAADDDIRRSNMMKRQGKKVKIPRR